MEQSRHALSGDYCHVIDHAFPAAPAQTFVGQRVNTYLECPPLQTLQEAGDSAKG